jgi:outer membrane protein TolC
MRPSWLIFAVALLPAPALGQTPDSTAQPVATLSLEEALQQARNHNPTYLSRLNNAATARMQVRNAYGSLLPSASVTAGLDYTGSGQANFGQGFTRQTSAVLGSSYSAGFQWQLDGSRLMAPRQQKANQKAVEEEIGSEANLLKFRITEQYLNVLQATAQVAVARQQVQRNQDFLDLANAKYRVGQGTLIEVRQAEVQKAQADVQLLRNLQTEATAKLELFNRIGVVPPLPIEQIALSDSFPVLEPTLSLDGLLLQAEEQNPELRALRARERAANTAVTSAKSEFLPSLSLRAGWSAFTQQQTDDNLLLRQGFGGAFGSATSCFTNDSLRVGAGLQPLVPTTGTTNCFTAAGLDYTGTSLSPQARRALLSSNDNFPFDFTKQPFSVGLTITLPLFTGFGRSLRLQQAREFARDADEQTRGRALAIRTEVHSGWIAVQTAYKAIAVQAASREAARDQLRLAQDRYRLGSGTALEVSDAQNAVQRAEGDYVNAIYDYHKALAVLESAVGRPLRP